MSVTPTPEEIRQLEKLLGRDKGKERRRRRPTRRPTTAVQGRRS